METLCFQTETFITMMGGDVSLLPFTICETLFLLQTSSFVALAQFAFSLVVYIQETIYLQRFHIPLAYILPCLILAN